MLTNPLAYKLFTFAFSKGFRNKETQEEFFWQKNKPEQVGSVLRWGIGNVSDIFLREIKNPVTIAGLTSLALLGVTMAFYPATVIAITAKVFPLALKMRPWMLKMAIYILAQTTIAGIGIRTYGRLCNELLLKEWETGHLRPIYVGEKKVVRDIKNKQS